MTYANTRNMAKLTNEELYRPIDLALFNSDREAAAAELARREEAQATGNNALMTEAAQKIDELLAENAHLRSLLAELIDQLVISELTEEDAERIEPLIGKAKEAIK